jgi:prepilin-type N-terminal cleavage/methylation domain-containing protein
MPARRARLLLRLRTRRAGERGFSLMELVIAVSILAIVAVGFTASIALGLRSVAFARQQQTASDLATARLEHLRSIPYSQVALESAPTHDTDPTQPDYGVSLDNVSFDVSGHGAYEPLVVDTANGGVLHIENPVQVGQTVMSIYQYVTWVDDPSIPGTQDYKRVTVVVRYTAPTINGVSRVVRVSSFFGTGNVVVGGTTTTTVGGTTTTAAATTTTSSSTTTTVAGACAGDNSAPTGSYTLNGSAGALAGFTAAASITVTMNLSDPCTPIQARLSNDGGSTWGVWTTYDPLNPTVAWTLPTGDGSKIVSFQTKDNKGNQAQFSNAIIVLDQTKPTTPASFTRTVTCSGSNRTVTLAWSLSNDTNFVGYRVYTSTDNITWTALLTTTSTSAVDVHKKSLDSVRYYVVGYDKAGNESNQSSIISLTKNQCS